MSKHTFELSTIKQATVELLSQNAEHLIGYIYENKITAPFNDAVTRVGLTLKVLLRGEHDTNTVSKECLEPAIEDLETLLSDTSITRSQRDVYEKELRFLNHCTMLDDIVTLNADMRSKAI